MGHRVRRVVMYAGLYGRIGYSHRVLWVLMRGCFGYSHGVLLVRLVRCAIWSRLWVAYTGGRLWLINGVGHLPRDVAEPHVEAVGSRELCAAQLWQAAEYA